jgi:hypothetical protein
MYTHICCVIASRPICSKPVFPSKRSKVSWGHAKLQTTLIYLHVKSPAPETTSPLDLMPTPPFKS